ncbi:hypothetical protein [Niallia sp. 01092]
MTEYEYLLQLKEQYENVQTSTDLKNLIDNFLAVFPQDQTSLKK